MNFSGCTEHCRATGEFIKQRNKSAYSVCQWDQNYKAEIATNIIEIVMKIRFMGSEMPLIRETTFYLFLSILTPNVLICRHVLNVYLRGLCWTASSSLWGEENDFP